VTSAEGLSGVDVNFTAQKGVQYQIAVDGNWPAFGNINLAVNQNGAPGALFQDSFSTSQGSWDVNYEAGLGRQAGGRLGVLYYVESANTSAGGPNDALTQVNSPQAPLQLLLNPTNNTWVSVSPGANFTQSGALQIEFDLNPGINDPGHTSSDWAGVVFGATGQNVYINQSDGMGILFRNNLQMQVFSGSNMIYQGDGGFVGGLPSGPFHVQINLKCADFQGSAATVALLINGVPAKIGPGGAALYTKSDGFQANYLTLLGYADWNQGWLDGFGNLKVGVPAPVAAVLGARLDASGNLVLTWATPLAGFNLQRADTLGGPWSAVTAPVTIQNGQNTVTLPATGQSRFFRLSKATGSPATFTDSHPPADRQVFYRTVSP